MFCIHCGAENKNGVNYCRKCGGSLMTVKNESNDRSVLESKIDEGSRNKLIGKINNAATTAIALAWFSIIVGVIAYTVKVFSGTSSWINVDLPGIIFYSFLDIVVIILGNRIKQHDFKTKKYLYIILFTYVTKLIIAVSTGGSYGYLLILLFIYLIQAIISIGKIKKDQALFNEIFKQHHYKFTTVWWILIGVFSIILVFVGAAIDPTSSDGSPLSENQNQEWKNYSSIDGSFSILTPSTPSQEVMEPEIVNDIKVEYTTYSVTDNNNDEYLIAVYDYNLKPSEFDNKKGIEGAINGAINNVEGAELISSKYSTFMGYQSADFSASFDEGNIKGKVVVKDDASRIRMYLIVGFGNNAFPINYDKFSNSFRILK